MRKRKSQSAFWDRYDKIEECSHLIIGKSKAQLLNTRLDGIPAGQSMASKEYSDQKDSGASLRYGIPNRDVSCQSEIFRLEDLVGAGVVQNGLGMNAGLVSEGTVATREMVNWDANAYNGHRTYVIGFMKGMLTSTASATKFSISRSIARLYLDLTYSGLAA